MHKNNSYKVVRIFVDLHCNMWFCINQKRQFTFLCSNIMPHRDFNKSRTISIQGYVLKYMVHILLKIFVMPQCVKQNVYCWYKVYVIKTRQLKLKLNLFAHVILIRQMLQYPGQLIQYFPCKTHKNDIAIQSALIQIISEGLSHYLSQSRVIVTCTIKYIFEWHFVLNSKVFIT